MVLIAFLASLLASPQIGAVPQTVSYVERNGEAEALADIAHRRPAKIYFREACGEACRIESVGISNCNPERFDTQKAPKNFFVEMPELYFTSNYDWQMARTSEQIEQAAAAYTFATSYNLAMFRENKNAILKQCPRAEVR